MKCPYCKSEQIKVTETRRKNGEYKRTRKCLNCNRLFKTTEIYVPEEIISEKKVGEYIDKYKSKNQTA